LEAALPPRDAPLPTFSPSPAPAVDRIRTSDQTIIQGVRDADAERQKWLRRFLYMLSIFLCIAFIWLFVLHLRVVELENFTQNISDRLTELTNTVHDWIVVTQLNTERIKILEKGREDFELNYAGILGRMNLLEARQKYTEDFVSNLSDVLGHVGREVEGVKQSVTEVKQNVRVLHQVVDDHYFETMKNSATLRTIDKWMSNVMGFFATQAASRYYFGLGCWPAGTKIQLDSQRNTIPVEDIKVGMKVWSQELQREVRVRLVLSGPESGHLYQITTSDGFKVKVTSEHGVKILDDRSSQTWRVVTAEKVANGTWTQTLNGIQQITVVERVLIEEDPIMVYNFELSLPNDLPATSYTVTSNGIVTGEFNAQKLLKRF